jgi:hypothetical protein
MNGRKLSMLAAILVLAAAIVVHRVEALHADEHGITLASLAGGFAESDSGIGTTCVGGCAAPTKLVPVNRIDVGQLTFDDSGNFCGVLIAVGAVVAGQQSPAVTSDQTIVGMITAFDSVTESGKTTFKVYTGGSCTGAVFNSNGSTFVGHGTHKIVVSQNANHIAVEITSVTNVTGTIAGAILLGSLDRQNF